jgi:hypothetical protein
MESDDIHTYYLRTSATPDRNSYESLKEARLALDNLVNAKSVDATSVTEEPDGKWVIRYGSTGSITAWIEDDKGVTVPLSAPAPHKA